MVTDDYKWAIALAEQIAERERIRHEKLERAKFERKFAGTEGRKLWEEVSNHVESAARAFNGVIQSIQGERNPVTVDRFSANQIVLRCERRSVSVNVTLNPEGSSFLQYTSDDGTAGSGAVVPRRFEFDITDDNLLKFSKGRRASDSDVMDAADVARFLFGLLFAHIEPSQ